MLWWWWGVIRGPNCQQKEAPPQPMYWGPVVTAQYCKAWLVLGIGRIGTVGPSLEAGSA